jgi:hypothetical protein
MKSTEALCRSGEKARFGAQRIKASGYFVLLRFLGGLFFGFFCSFEFESKVNRNATGTPSPLAIDSNFSKDGAFLPRSIRLRKSTEMPTISAKASWVFFRS